MPRDDGEPLVWYRKAAGRGIAHAQFRLGNVYATGDGVMQDYVRAYAWWSLAAAQGYGDAEALRDGIGGAMTPEQIVEAERLSRDLVSQ